MSAKYIPTMSRYFTAAGFTAILPTLWLFCWLIAVFVPAPPEYHWWTIFAGFSIFSGSVIAWAVFAAWFEWCFVNFDAWLKRFQKKPKEREGGCLY